MAPLYDAVAVGTVATLVASPVAHTAHSGYASTALARRQSAGSGTGAAMPAKRKFRVEAGALSIATDAAVPGQCKFGSAGSRGGRVLAFRWRDIHKSATGFVSRSHPRCKGRAMLLRYLDLHPNRRWAHRVATRDRRGPGGGHQVDQLLLTPENAAELLAVGRTKIYELLRTGAIESVRIGAARRIPATALTTYVSNSAKTRRSTPTAATRGRCPEMARRGRGEGSIYRRDDGTWVAVIHLGWHDGKRRRKYLYARTRAEVRDKYRKAQRALEEGRSATTTRTSASTSSGGSPKPCPAPSATPPS